MNWRLYVDIGNSALKWAARSEGNWISQGGLPHFLVQEADGTNLRVPPAIRAEAAVQELSQSLRGDGLRPEQCDGIVVVSSFAQVDALVRLLGSLAPVPPRRLGGDLVPALTSEYYRPAEIGMDRWANAAAAIQLHGAPAVVVDAGTCITSEVINADGALVGGCIALGLPRLLAGISGVSERLAEAAAQEMPEEPAPTTGRSTAEAVRAGVILQVAATADRFIAEGRREVGAEKTIITGGDAELCLAYMQETAVHEPLLTLEGLRILDQYD